MRILILQFVPDVRERPVPRFEPQLGTLLSLLLQREHELSLLGLARFDVVAVKAALARGLPQLIYADISAVCVDVARRTLQYVQEHEFIPVVAGGGNPTVDPAGSLSLPGVQAVAVGEPDASLVTYLERIKDPAVGQVVLGVWARDERGLDRPELPPLVEDLDSLPFPERDLFGYGQYVQRTGEIEIAVGRGCPHRCAYCLNDRLAEMYAQRGTWVRRRSPENVLDEIDLLRGKYDGVRIVRFLDHAFALDPKWLAEFLDAYAARWPGDPGGAGACAERVGASPAPLPFRCHLRANAAERETIAQLAQAGCQLVDLELISASDFIRNEIFDMDLSGEQISSVFGQLRAAGIRTRAIVYLGAPYESEASFEDTRALLERLKPDAVDVRPYYPWPGVRATDTCRENGWVHTRGEEQFRRDLPGIDMPACRPEQISAFVRRLRQEFPAALDEPWWRRWSNASRSALEQLFHKRR